MRFSEKFKKISTWIPNLSILLFAISLDCFFYPYSSLFVFTFFFLVSILIVFFPKMRHILPLHIFLFLIYGIFGILNEKWIDNQFHKQFDIIYNLKKIDIIKSFPANGDGGNGGWITGRSFLVNTDLSQSGLQYYMSEEIDINKLKTREMISIYPIPKKFHLDKIALEIIDTKELQDSESRWNRYYSDEINRYSESFRKSKFLIEYSYWEEDPF